MDREPLPDYSFTIRAQIEREVRSLTPRWGAHTVDLGYMVNSHHGMALYKDGDTIAGVRVRINTQDRRTIRVGDSKSVW